MAARTDIDRGRRRTRCHFDRARTSSTCLPVCLVVCLPACLGMATFPTLSANELRELLNDIKCTVPPELDIDRPTRQACIPVYAWFWESITGIGFASIREGADAYTASALDEESGEQELYKESLLLGMQYETL